MNKRKIIGIILFIMAAVGIIGSENKTEALAPAIIFVIIGLVLILIKPKSKKERQQSKENAKKIMEDKINKFYAEHQAGLPIATGVSCTVSYSDDKFTFIAGGNSFNLDFNKITDVCIKTDTEIQKQYVSSVGGAIAGGMVFGPLGAIVGGRAKEKKSRTHRNYLIFTYLKNDNIDYISFDITNSSYKIYTIVDKFKKNNIMAESKTVDL